MLPRRKAQLEGDTRGPTIQVPGGGRASLSGSSTESQTGAAGWTDREGDRTPDRGTVCAKVVLCVVSVWLPEPPAGTQGAQETCTE